MKYVFAFEGQGSVLPLMGKKEFELDPIFRETLLNLEKILNVDVRNIIWGHQRFELKNNIFFAHIALFVTELSLFKALTERGFTPNFIIGHSLGEIIGIIASGAISLENGALLIKKRGELFEKLRKAYTSDMVALIGKFDDIISCLNEFEASVRTPVYIANLNSPKQIVVSLSISDIPKIFSFCSKYKIKPKLLKIGVGCHSPFVKPIYEELNKIIKNLDIKSPVYPLYSASFNEQLEEPERIKYRLMQHLLSPVKWSDSIKKLIDIGYNKFIDIGFSKILKGLIRDINYQAKVEFAPHFLRKILKPGY